MIKRAKKNAGFSLTEVLIAAGILAVGFMMLLTLFPLGLQLTAKQTENTMGYLAARQTFTNARLILNDGVSKAPMIPVSGAQPAYRDFRELFWAVDKDSDGIIDAREADYSAANGDYELTYDPYLFMYPLDSSLSDEDKKYGTTVLIGGKDGDYADMFVYTYRRLGSEARFPLVFTDDFDNPDNVGNRPVALSLTIDNDFVDDDEKGNLIMIDDSHYTALDNLVDKGLGLASFIAVDSEIIVDSTARTYRVSDVSSHKGEHYIRIHATLTGADREKFKRIWFVPPAIGAGRSAAVDLARQTIKVN